MSDSEAKKVFIQSREGDYLTGSGAQWGFTNERTRATVFDYVLDRVAEQIEGIRGSQGTVLIAVPVDPREIHEVCDGCDQLMAPAKAFFDGEKFLCMDCR